MKLYTEEQVKEIYFKGLHNGRLHIEGRCSDEVESLTPIELPSDEEIEREFTAILGGEEYKCYDMVEGAIWMRDKIHGDNK
jgi:hypothetical protein